MISSRPLGVSRRAARLLGGIGTGLLFAGVVSLLVFQVPPMMDEMQPYHLISCLFYPNAHYNTFLQPCDGSLDLTVLGLKLPLRAFTYVGATSSLLYFPLFALVRNFHSARFLGALFILLALAGIRRLTRASPLTVLAVAGLSFPLAFQMMTNTGHVALQCALLVWVPVLMRDAMLAERRSRILALNLSIGALLFLGVEQKPFFMLFIPTLALVGFLLSAPADQSPLRHLVPFVRRLAPAGALLGSLLLLLFSARTHAGKSYWEELPSVPDRPPGPIVPYLLDLSRFAHRLFEAPCCALGRSPNLATDIACTAIFWAVVLVALATGLQLSRRPSARALVASLRQPALVLAGGSLLIWCSLLIFWKHGVWAGHHVVFVFPYLLSALCLALEALAPKTRALLLSALVLSQLGLFAGLLQKKPAWHANWERVELLDHLTESGLGRTSIVAHVDWGTYYLSALYGDREQIVVNPHSPETEETFRQLKDLARETKRSIVFVRTAKGMVDWRFIQRAFDHLELIHSVGDAQTGWELWRWQG
jgi:hypothetical protein